MTKLCSESLETRPPLQVLHVIPGLGVGGAERAVLTMLATLEPSVCTCLLAVVGGANVFPDRASHLGRVEHLGFDGSYRRPREMARAVGRLRHLIKVRRISVVHSHLWPATFVAAWAVARSSVKHVVHVHDTSPWLEGRAWRDWAKKTVLRFLLNRNPPRYLAVSEAAKQFAMCHLKIAECDVSVVPNGVDLNRFRPATVQSRNASVLRIGMVGRFSPEKNHVQLIAVLGELISRGLDCELWFAGDGSTRPECEALARAGGVADRVRFLGWVEDVEAFLYQLDVFVLPSSREGMPLTILEAMACGTCVVATDVGGTSEVIRDGHNGVLVRPGDFSELSRILERLLRSPQERQRLQSAGLEAVSNRFSCQRVARDIEQVYQEWR